MNIIIISPTRIEVDGKDSGTLLDFYDAHPELHKQLRAIVADWHDSHVKEDQRREKELEDAKKSLEVRCEEHRKEHQEKSAALSDAATFRAQQFSAEVQTAIQRFLGQSDVSAVLKAKEKAELQAKLAALG